MSESFENSQKYFCFWTGTEYDDAKLHIIEVETLSVIATISTKSLTLTCMTWLSDNLILCGRDYGPMTLFRLHFLDQARETIINTLNEFFEHVERSKLFCSD